MILNDFIYDVQTNPCPFTFIFSRIEWLKNLIANFLRYTHTVIADGDYYGIFFFPCLYLELSIEIHSLTGIHNKVGPDLINLVFMSYNRKQWRNINSCLDSIFKMVIVNDKYRLYAFGQIECLRVCTS